jgi:ureidoglycolate dehydrogenase (NAD+)
MAMERAGQTAHGRVLAEDLHAFCVEAMVRAGLRPADARTTAEVLVTTDTWGVYTHGSKQLQPLLSNVRDGRIQAAASPQVEREGPSWAIVDGGYAMPPVTGCMAMQLAIDKARATGIAYVGVKNSGHFGAAGYYAVMAAQQEMIGLSVCNVDPGVTVPGARGKVLGTNPIAFAVPAGRERIVFLDIATSAVAASKLYAAQDLGRPIPSTWMVGDDGLPTTDPAGYPARGALYPMAGHKGYGIALLVEVLSAVLTGAGMTSQVGSWKAAEVAPTNQGHGFIAINVAAMMPLAEFKARMDWLIRFIHESPKAAGSERILVPGEAEWERRDAALTAGIELPPDVVASLEGAARDWGLSLSRVFRATKPDHETGVA